MADYKLTIEIFDRFERPRRKTGKLTAADYLDAAMKALLLQANMGEKLDVEAHEELYGYIQRELSRNKLYKQQPLKAMQQLADYNSEEINIKLVGPSGRVLLDTFPGENEEGVDFDESGKPASARARVQEEYELTEGASIPQAVKFAFPELEPRAAKIIAGWYAAEGAAEDFESAADLAKHIESDITDMVWAASNPKEIAIVKAGLITGGFVDADDLPEEEDFDESKSSASVKSILREAAKPVQQDKLGSWYKQSFKERNNVAPFESVIYEILEDQTGIESGEQLFAAAQAEAARDPKFNVEWQAFLKKTPQNKDGVLAKLANTLGFYQVRESAKADKPKMKEALGDKDWSEFQQYMFNAISKVYRRFNIGKGPSEATADKMDLIKVLDWMDAHGFWDGPENY